MSESKTEKNKDYEVVKTVLEDGTEKATIVYKNEKKATKKNNS